MIASEATPDGRPVFKLRRNSSFRGGLALVAAVFLGLLTSSSAEIQFNKDVRPILSELCFQCHGPDPGSRKADMRFDRRNDLFAQREAGVPVVPGDLNQSLLWQRITSSDPDEMMPPPESHKQLTSSQRETLRQWIEEGAEWEPFWALIPPSRPPVPAVQNAGWVSNPIDAFILKGLEQAGLQPAPEADRRSLGRRASLDATGLPPEPQAIEALLADDSPAAYENYLERLLHSPAFGEHRARFWLDAARYADTHGLHFDNYREMWPYRDWVIRAYNANVPFDRFTLEQLAGDLLPDPDLDQLVATGFHRCCMTTNEGGTIPEENAVSYARDRVETTGAVWLGLTLNCTTCHDHKFDPVTMRDFYSLSAYFRNTVQSPLDGNIFDTPPVVRVPSRPDRKRIEAIDREMAELEAAAAAIRAQAAPEVDAWLAALDPASLQHPVSKDLLALHIALNEGQGHPISGTGPGGAPVEIPLTDSARWADGAPGGSALEISGGDGLSIGDFGDLDAAQAFSLGAWVRPSDRVPFAAVVARMDEDSRARGWDLAIQDYGTRPVVHLVHAWPRRAIKVVARDPVLKPGEWRHVFAVWDGSGKASGLQLYVDGQPIALRVENDSFEGSLSTGVPLRIGARSRGVPFTGGAVQDVRIYRSALPAEAVGNVRASVPVMRALASAGSPESREILTNYYLDAHDPGNRSLAANKRVLEAERASIDARSPVTHVMQDRNDAEALAHILYRGQYDQRRDEVRPGVPEALHDLPAQAPPNRLGLAQWINSPDNPLTARVAVNRIWQEIFGTGLVATAGDFGIMGEHPSHPELLDWLAVEFRESGWDVKHILRLILSSTTYRQSPVVTSEKLDRDAANRLLSRGPRFRLEAEMLRDYALAASGLLSTRIGGPSVKPYQPPGVWEAVAMPESNTRSYQEDRGESLYRRGLYTFWKRAAPPASMEILNAPSRETCTVRRERTNTPIQALLTLNDPQFIEAARALAQSVLPAASGSRERLQALALRVLLRPLNEEELAVLEPSLAEFEAYYASHAGEAAQLLAVGELRPNADLDPRDVASWTMLANQLLNLDEALNK